MDISAELSQHTLLDFTGAIYWGQTGTSNYYVAIKDDDFGVLDVNYLIG